MDTKYEMFRCPCGASGLYTTEKCGHIIEAFCPPTANFPFVCPAVTSDEAEQCPHAETCKYCELLETLPKGFEWECVCGWEEAEERRLQFMPTWFAVLRDEEDDWGTGSYDLDEAIKMAKEGDYEQIAFIEEGSDPICVDELYNGKDF